MRRFIDIEAEEDSDDYDEMDEDDEGAEIKGHEGQYYRPEELQPRNPIWNERLLDNIEEKYRPTV